MAKGKNNEINTEEDNVRFVPTEEEEFESRRDVERVQRESRFFTRTDFEAVLKSATKHLKKEQDEKESAKT